MRILYSPEIFSAQKYGGISRYYTDLISEMMSDNDIIIPQLIHNNVHLREYQASNDIKKFGKYINIKTKLLLLSRFANEYLLNKSVKKLERNNHSYIYHSTFFVDFIKSRRSRKIVTVYDMINEKFGQTLNLPKNKNIILQKQKAMQNADHIIAISETTKNDILNYTNIHADKITVVHLNASKHFNINRTLNIKKQNTILYVGNRNYYKNFRVLIDSLSKDKYLKSNFKLICFGGEKLSSREKKLIGEMGLTSCIEFTNGNSHDLRLLYNQCKAFVFPSLYEGFGIPIIESINSSCIPICTNIPVFKEIGKDSLVYFDDIDDLIEKLKYVLGLSADDYENILNKCRNVTKTFTIDKMVSSTKKIYTSLL